MPAFQHSAPMILPVVYIAGPYRALTPRRVLANIWVAQEAALTVWKLGAVAICPHSNCYLFDDEAPSEVWLDGDLELLRRSDAMLLCGEWQGSAGAQREHQLAVELGLPIFYDTAPHVLRGWVEQWKRAAQVE
jgi:hypothetical protein